MKKIGPEAFSIKIKETQEVVRYNITSMSLSNGIILLQLRFNNVKWISNTSVIFFLISIFRCLTHLK